MIWRDDDILWRSHGLDELLAVDDLLQAAGQRHTIAIIASTLTSTVAQAIVARRMIAQLHGWQHEDLTRTLRAVAQLADAVQKIEDLTGQRPTVLYPPWNHSNRALVRAAARLHLLVSVEKISLEQYIRCQGQVDEATINFHYWHQPDRAALRQALVIATEAR